MKEKRKNNDFASRTQVASELGKQRKLKIIKPIAPYNKKEKTLASNAGSAQQVVTAA
ncbi:MAG: hypothetical protein JNM63_14205 [Spirochaetia bacterium]|nr:hypothetical protein [Spirochaetia bacterium]